MSVRRSFVTPAEIFGLRPLGKSLRQCKLALLGDASAPPSRWGPSSLRILKPWVSVPTWLGHTRADRRVFVYNLPNRTPQPRDLGYSVRVTDCRDFRGRRLTYDGHVGTDFALPPGTRLCAAAPGVVRGVVLEMQRGGRKVYVDHGDGLVTTYSHLSRALVEPGQRLARGEVLGLSGMSGVDGVLMGPLLAPHLHFNAVLDGLPIDPWAAPGETSLWLDPNAPTPWDGATDAAIPAPTWDATAVDAALDVCADAAVAERLRALPDLAARGFALAIEQVFRPFLFPAPLRLTAQPTRRAARLSLPLHREDFDGVVMLDDVGPALLRALASG